MLIFLRTLWIAVHKIDIQILYALTCLPQFKKFPSKSKFTYNEILVDVWLDDDKSINVIFKKKNFFFIWISIVFLKRKIIKKMPNQFLTHKKIHNSFNQNKPNMGKWPVVVGFIYNLSLPPTSFIYFPFIYL